MPHVRLFPAVSRLPRSPFASAPRSGRLFGLFGVLFACGGLVVLGLASMPLLAGATEVCNPQSTGVPKCQFVPEEETGVPLGSLRGVVKETDPELLAGGRYVRNQTALVALGKALFWDQQVGSDGQACASCHFSAGADPRTRNQISPGLKSQPNADTGFELGKPNHELAQADFPIHKLQDPGVKTPYGTNVKRDANDVVSSQGVFYREFGSVQSNPFGSMNAPREPFDRNAIDNCVSKPDPMNFKVGNVNVRRVEPRNTPTMINAMFTNRNFWDSRAQSGFNGASPFGERDPNAFVYENTGSPIFGQPVETRILIKFSSLASQADGPPANEFEMSCLNRTLPDVGHKLLFSTPTPLAQQVVSEHDSALGHMSNARNGNSQNGLAVKYPELIALAFQPRWWDSIRPVVTRNAGTRPQIEANFSLFFGLSVQAYMETLRADRTPLDRFMEDPTFNLSPSQLRGLKLFESSCAVFDSKGICVKAERPDPPRNPTTRVESLLFDNKTPADLRCTTCHGGPETTAARIDAVMNDARLERMAQATGATRGCAIYDAGHFNTGVRPTHEDPALGATDQWGNSFGETQLVKDGLLAKLVPGALEPFGLKPAFGGTTNCDGMNVMGTFKAPQLRNVELTGPYFHNGGQLTLRQVVDFYNRGGDFDNTQEFDPNVHPLHLGAQDKNDLVAFLMALTDERVAYEREPFDHPSICVANGAEGTETGVTTGRALPGEGPAARAKDQLLCVNAVGANGRSTRLKPFLGVNQFSATSP